jgi:hypothetical protein
MSVFRILTFALEKALAVVLQQLDGRIVHFVVVAVMWFCMAMGATAYVLLVKEGKTMIDLKGRSYAALCDANLESGMPRIQSLAFAGDKPPKSVCLQDHSTH